MSQKVAHNIPERYVPQGTADYVVMPGTGEGDSITKAKDHRVHHNAKDQEVPIKVLH